MADKYWEECNKFLKVFAAAYGKLYRKEWTKKQYNEHMAEFYRSKEMYDAAQEHQDIADNEDALPNSI